jgi:hypothetical protein
LSRELLEVVHDELHRQFEPGANGDDDPFKDSPPAADELELKFSAITHSQQPPSLF